MRFPNKLSKKSSKNKSRQLNNHHHPSIENKSNERQTATNTTNPNNDDNDNNNDSSSTGHWLRRDDYVTTSSQHETDRRLVYNSNNDNNNNSNISQRSNKSSSSNPINDDSVHDGGSNSSVVSGVVIIQGSNAIATSAASMRSIRPLDLEMNEIDDNAEVVYERFGPALDVLSLRHYDMIPMINDPYSVLIKIKASTVSLTDCLIRSGTHRHISTPLPSTPGLDLVGTIVKVGSLVTQFAIGDNVATICKTNGNASYALLPMSQLIKIPSPSLLDLTDAVTMVTIYMSAYQAIHRLLPKRNEKEMPLEGKTVLVTGGIGPVGQAVIQLLFRAGVATVFSTGKEQHAKFLKFLGARPLPWERDRWLPEVKGRMDIVIDLVGEDWNGAAREALTEEGSLIGIKPQWNNVCCDDGGGYWEGVWSSAMTMVRRRTYTYDVIDWFENHFEEYKHDLNYLFRLLNNGNIKPKMVERIPLSGVADAHVRLETGCVEGIVVCTPWGDNTTTTS